jgi:hypothetical protein
MAKAFASRTTNFMKQTVNSSHAACQAGTRSAESMGPRQTQYTGSQCAFRIKTVTPSDQESVFILDGE